ncbi:MAG TPA: hypothetical protein VGF79_02220 [Bacteroidia bacterium]
MYAQLDSVRGYLIFSSESIKQAYATKVSVSVYDVYQRKILSLNANENGYFAFKLSDTYQDSVIEVNASCRIIDQKKIDSICPCVYKLNCRGFFDSRSEILRSVNLKPMYSQNEFKDFNKMIYLRMNEAFCQLDTSFFYIKDQMVDTNRNDFKMKLNCLDQRFINALKRKKDQLVVTVFIDTSSNERSTSKSNFTFNNIETFLYPFSDKYGQFKIEYFFVIDSNRKEKQNKFFVQVKSK